VDWSGTRPTTAKSAVTVMNSISEAGDITTAHHAELSVILGVLNLRGILHIETPDKYIPRIPPYQSFNDTCDALCRYERKEHSVILGVLNLY